MPDEVKPAAPAAAAAPAATAPQEVKPEVAAAAAKPADAVAVAAAATPEANPLGVKPQDPKATDPAAAKPVVPDKYELKLPENSPLNASHLDALASLAKEQGLSQAQAQAMLERDSASATAGVEFMRAKAEQMSKQWLEEAKADPDFGGAKFEENVSLASRALDELFPGVEIRKFMDVSGLGNHPSMLKGFAKIGRMLHPEKIIGNGAQPPDRAPLKHRMYDHPTSPKT